MMFPSLSRSLLLVCALLLPGLSLAESEPDKWEKMRVEKRRNTLKVELEALKKSRDIALKTNQRTDTIDLGIKIVQEELEVLADGRAETKEERLTRTLANYKRQRALAIKLGQSTAGLDKMIASAERQLRGEPHAQAPRPGQKPNPAPHDIHRANKIEGCKRSIASLQKSIGHHESRGMPVPQALQNMLARKKAELAELEK